MNNMWKSLPAVALVAVAFTAPASAQCGLAGLEVKVTPAKPKIGEKITVTVRNTSTSCTYNLPTSCVFQRVHQDDCQGFAVVDLICLSSLTPIGPGQIKSQVWDQIGDDGAQVIDGTYVIEVQVWDHNFASLLKICVPVDIGCTPPPSNYGTSSKGTGGIEPILGYGGGAPVAGNTNFQLQVLGGLGGAPAAMFVGVQPTAIPAGWGTFLIDPTFPMLQFLFTLGGTPGAPGLGNATIPAPVPNIPGIGGATAYAQVLIGDPGSTGGISHTKGLVIPICQ